MATLAEFDGARQLRKLLSPQLRPAEIKIIIDVFRCDQHGGTYRATRLGIAESLCRRQWLVREPDGSIHLSAETRALIAEVRP